MDGITKDFHVGDRVIGLGVEDGLDITGRIGTIECLQFGMVTVEFDERFDERLHGGEYSGTGKCWICRDNMIDWWEEPAPKQGVVCDFEDFMRLNQ